MEKIKRVQFAVKHGMIYGVFICLFTILFFLIKSGGDAITLELILQSLLAFPAAILIYATVGWWIKNK